MQAGGSSSGAPPATNAGGGGAPATVGRLPLYKLFSYADGWDVLLMVVGGLCAAASGLAQPFMTLIFGKVIDAFGRSYVNAGADVLDAVNKVVIYFVYLGVGAGVVSAIQVVCWTVTGERQATRIRSLYLRSVLRQDIGYFDKELTTGQVIERMSGDTFLLQEAIGEKVGNFLQLVSTFFGGFIVAFVVGWQLALVMLATIPPIVFAGALVSRLITTVSSRAQAKYGDAGNIVEQTIGAIRTVVSFNGEEQAIATYNRFIHIAFESTIIQGGLTGLGLATVMAILFSSYGLAVWYGARLIYDHRGYNGGTVINVLMAVMMGAMSLGQSTPSIVAFAEGSAAAYRMFETINRTPAIDSADESGVVLEEVKGEVELREVHFSYPTRPDYPIFDGFSLRVHSGTSMAIVGESGSGKSTVISLVQRFYDPHSGEVLVDGVDIRKMKLPWLRRQIGLVSQEPLLFSTTIRENVAYGKDGATADEIRRAIQLANAANFVDKLPNGLETMVGERGTQLSGGQKQRIAIARAILKNPKILLLDEATSALDLESERVVQDALNRIVLQRTTIIVAHRLSTVKNADMISVLHRGKVVEQGSHGELLKNPHGHYSQLVHLQNEQGDEGRDTGVDPDMLVPPSAAASDASKSKIKRSSSSLGRSSRHSFAAASLGFPEPPADTKEAEDDSGKEETKKKASIGRLFLLNRPEAPILFLGCVAAGIHGVIFPIFGILISSAITAFYEPPEKMLKDISFWATMFVVVAAGALTVIPISYFLFGLAGSKLVERIRSMTFRSAMHQEINWFDMPENSSGTIAARLSTDALNVKRLVGDNLALNMQIVSTLLSGFLIAIIANWRLALVITVVVPFIASQGYLQVKFLKGFSTSAKLKYEEATHVANDAIGGIRTVASFCMEPKIVTVYDRLCEVPRRQGMREGIVGGSGFGFSYVVFYNAYALCFFVGAKFISQGLTTFPEVFRVFFALVLATIGLSRTSAMGSDSTKARESAASIFAILDRKSAIDYDSEGGVIPSDGLIRDIELEHVSFTYPMRPAAPIFRDLSLTIPAGKTVALVGESGSGKSTVIALLERFYDADGGKILVDGVEIKELNLRWLRQQMGLVAQEPVLFNDTIRANIAYGKPGASEEEIVAAATAANAHQFISGLPEGYDSTVGERGIQLSGGQKQRVAIARAVIKDPKVLLLDEATSALDTESERVVQEALDRVMVGRTTVVVAHRLTTVRNADVIAVLKDGAVAELGRHEELMRKKNGIYASMQLLGGGTSSASPAK